MRNDANHLLHTLAGLVPVISGTVATLGHRPPSGLHRRVRDGIRLVTEERAIIRRLSVLDNLRLGDGLRGGLRAVPGTGPAA